MIGLLESNLSACLFFTEHKYQSIVYSVWFIGLTNYIIHYMIHHYMAIPLYIVLAALRAPILVD